MPYSVRPVLPDKVRTANTLIYIERNKINIRIDIIHIYINNKRFIITNEKS